MEGEEEEGMVLCFVLPASCGGRRGGGGEEEKGEFWYLSGVWGVMALRTRNCESRPGILHNVTWQAYTCSPGPLSLPPLTPASSLQVLHSPVARPPSDVPRGPTRQIEG